MPLVHETVRAELNARRRGTASTKTRGIVCGGGAKPWRQRRTGRARAGSSRSPLWTGGRVVFGPHPRSYVVKVNRKAHRAALRSALSVHAERDSMAVFDGASSPSPSTEEAFGLLSDWGSSPGVAAAPDRRGGRRRAVVPQPRPRLGDAARGRRGRGRVRAASLLVSEAALPGLVPGGARAPLTSAPTEEDADGSQPGDHPAGRVREVVRARRGRQVHLPRPRQGAQDPDPPGDRGALRRQHVSMCAPPRSKASPSAGARPPVGRAGRRRPSSRYARATRSRSSHGWRRRNEPCYCASG